MVLPSENVGSLPRPLYLQQALADFDAGKITRDELTAAQDRAAADSVSRLEATGSEVVSDGEQWSSSFATYPLLDTLGGSGLAPNLAADADGQYFAFFADGHHRQLPRLVRGPFRYQNYAGDYLARSKRHARLPMKQAVVSPSLLYLLYPLDGAVPGYARERFEADLVDECERDIRGCLAAGAARVSVDFTEGRLACRRDARNPWTARGLLPTFVDLNNRVLARFAAPERRNIGIHTCPGGDCDSTHSADVDYADLLPALFQINAGYFLIQCASERDKERVYRTIGENIRRDADGVKQVAFIGVTNPLDPTVETPEQVARDLVAAARYIPTDQLGATDDCGFSPFSIDSKPRHAGGPDAARDIAFRKIASRVEGVRIASERLGV
ncbi:UROD/MetE-like protein [Biscogniauxia sp. FL1348]|nr:UROD/MetE-like protein [Biscogniauxia sp. FL1348]